MKSKCCYAEVKWIKLIPYCSKCHKHCEVIENRDGLKVIDGTPTALSKYLRERGK